MAWHVIFLRVRLSRLGKSFPLPLHITDVTGRANFSVHQQSFPFQNDASAFDSVHYTSHLSSHRYAGYIFVTGLKQNSVNNLVC